MVPLETLMRDIQISVGILLGDPFVHLTKLLDPNYQSETSK